MCDWLKISVDVWRQRSTVSILVVAKSKLWSNEASDYKLPYVTYTEKLLECVMRTTISMKHDDAE